MKQSMRSRYLPAFFPMAVCTHFVIFSCFYRPPIADTILQDIHFFRTRRCGAGAAEIDEMRRKFRPRRRGNGSELWITPS